jgi:hypothetical protein
MRTDRITVTKAKQIKRIGIHYIKVPNGINDIPMRSVYIYRHTIFIGSAGTE